MNKKLVGIGVVLVCLLFFGSCKPKQSVYKSVYEAAKQRDLEQNKDVPNIDYTKQQDSLTSQENAELAQQEAIPQEPATEAPTAVLPAEPIRETVRTEKITAVSNNDASQLKAYSVVIAAMGMKPNAVSLKERIEAEGYKVILAQNEAGIYRVIIASCDTRDEAIARKNEILSHFRTIANSDAALRMKYGIPFNDWWILQRKF